MLIVSKFHDYYDSASTFGIDKTVVYKRDKIEIDLRETNLPKGGWREKLPIHETQASRWSNQERVVLMPVIIGFCGKTYIIYVYEDEKEVSISSNLDSTLILLGKYNQKTKHRNSKYFKKVDDRKSMIDAYAEWHNVEHNEIFIKYKVPVFVCKYEIRGNTKVILNDCLSDFCFFKIKDSFTSFNEIQSYISGVLGQDDKPIVETSEKDKIQSKGFDKWSFRNPDPPKRKQR